MWCPFSPRKKGEKGANQECQALARLYESRGQADLAEPETYKPGEPLVRLTPGTELSKVRGAPAAAVHKHYMDNFKKPVSEKKDGFMAKVKPEVFHHDLLDGQFIVDWTELWHVMNFSPVDSSTMRIVTL